MFRRHWREPAFWRWWWGNQAPHGAKVSLAGLALLGFLAVGFFAALGLSEADAGSTDPRALTFQTTVDKLVTVRERGRVVVRRVPVVRRVVYRPETAVRTLFGTRVRVVTTPGRAVVEKRLVTVGGKTRTIIATQTVSGTRTQTRVQTETRTQTRVQTETNVVTDQQTVVRTETLPVTVQQTVVQTLPSQTVTVTVPITVTITVPKP
jgi:hypothetical protein